MEEIIKKLLATDTEIIQQATTELNEALKNPESTRALCQILVSSQEKEVRQYAAVLLRKRYRKKSYWTHLPDPVKQEFKSLLLQALVHEPEKSVKNAIAQLIGTIVEHELPHNSWPEAFQFIQQLVTDTNIASQELGMFTLSTMTEIAYNVFLPHVNTIMNLLHETLNKFTDLANPVSCYVLEVMLHLVPLVEGNQDLVNAYHHMMPRVMQIIHSLTAINQAKAIKGFELLDELCECAATVISPHVRNLVEMCVTIANNELLEEELRTKSVIFLGWLTKVKKKAIVKHKLVEPIVDTLFMLMCSKPDDENQEVYFTGEDDNTPITSATQTLDLLALHLPPEKLVPYLLKHIEPGLEDSNIYACKASYLSMAVLAEGCSEYIRTKYLETFLSCICSGITNSQPVVRNAALFALGQFSEHLQPDISRYADELLPVLLQYLNQTTTQIRQENKESPSTDRMFYALEMFAENLNEGLLPYLPNLMSILFEILEDANSPVHISELALSAIGAAANASKEHMMPYFEKIIALIQPYLNVEKDNQERACLQIQAVDTLGVLARTVGIQNFAPLAMKSLELGINLLKETEDPDLKKSIYGLLASISVVMKNEMSIVLPVIIEYMITSVKSSEGILTHVKDDDSTVYLSNQQESDRDEEDIEDTDNEDDDDEDFVGYSVENAYVEEKEEAILALREIAENTKEAFMPYLESSFEEVLKVVNYPQEDIKKAAIDALMQFTVNFSKIETPEGKAATQKALSVLIPKFSELIRLDEERDVVIQSLDALSELLEQLKTDAIVGYGHKDAVKNIITDVMLGRIQCQDQEYGEDDDDGEAEHDELLFEYAGQVLVNYGRSVPNDDFALCFKDVLPMFLKRLKRHHSESQRSYSIGTIAECLPLLGNQVPAFAHQFFPAFIKLANDSSAEVRSNAIFALGELAFFGKEHIYSHYPQILQALSGLISHERSAQARDNIIGAIARLIITNHTIIPIEQVFPVFISHLPLKEDLEENKTVYKCVLVLYRNGHAILRPHIPTLLKVALDIFENKASDNEVKSIVREFVVPVQKDFPDEWNTFCSQLSEESAALIKQIFL
ncbi:importin-4-like [Phymastichus coffea]|uniref:importin-4-like n=1 Tax=Phymastichus coffea TaxID=108790 RepID=UPI00273C0602|nr:importin-4-like [Phymastichus coffea]